MQPTLKFKKTLLASALILGTGITFSASADLFTVSAGAIPDVGVEFVAGFESLSFGTGIIGNKVGFSCDMVGLTGIGDALLKLDQQGADGETAAAANFGEVSGQACITSTEGTPVVIEIDGAIGSTVSVTVNNVIGAGYTYTPTDESCVVNFDGGTGADSCESLEFNTVSGVGMNTYGLVDGVIGAGTTENASTTAYQYGGDFLGKTRMVLAGSITIDSEIAAGTAITDNIIVQVTYE